MQDGASGQQMVLTASHQLVGVVLSVSRSEYERPPSEMRAVDGQVLEWRIALGGLPEVDERSRRVARADGSSYFGEASTLFLQPKDGPDVQR